MFLSIAGFEFRYQIRSPVFWVAVIIFFLLGFGAVASENVKLGASGNVHANGPYALAFAHSLLLIFYMFAATAFVANVVVRDDETRFGAIVRSTRITKFDYLFGRFTGAFAAAALAFLSVPLGLFLGSLMPWVDPETVGPNRLNAYAFAYFVLAVPGIFLMSAIFFALATATRSMMATYLGVVAFLVLYITSDTALQGRNDLEKTRALIEPFGFGAFGLATRYWTAAERNTQIVPLEGTLLWNRLLWLGIAFAFLAGAYAIYRFADRGISKRKERKQKRTEEAAAMAPIPSAAVRLPPTRLGAAVARAQLWSRTRFEMKQVFKSPAFAILLLLGLGMFAIGLVAEAGIYGTQTIPVTRSMVRLLGAFSLFPLIIAIYYAGELVWRERERKVHEIIDATPLPNWAYIIPKTIALSLVLLSTLVVGVLAAILTQLLKGYTNLEPGKYLLWYLLPSSVVLIRTAVLAIFVQALAPSKYAGWGIMVLYMVLRGVASALGFEHNLYLFGGSPGVSYSDLNGAGDFWKAQAWFSLYWGAFALLMLVAAHLLWRRGTETRVKPRLRLAASRLRGAPGVIAGAALAVALLTGGWIFYNTNILNEYRTSDQEEVFSANYEKKFLRYEKLAQPTASAVVLDVALYPAQHRAVVHGRYQLKNLTAAAISDVHIRRPSRDVKILNLGLAGARLASDDREYGYRIYRLDRPMAPGETRELTFETVREQRGFRNSGNDQRIVGNGTFINNFELVPVVGMNRQGLLGDRAKRRKYGLAPELRPAKLEDLSATARNYISGWTTADITVSTVAGQTPIAPGKKVSDVTANGRRTARFVSDAPIMNFFSIQSARYAEKHLNHRGLDLAVYYHPTHVWNIDRMLRAMRISLDYYQANFGPYQFDQARIIEFPAYQTFAQAFANTMPYSEGFGFVADASDPDKIDYVTYVIAHELSHQYWGHQIAGADMQGGTMLVETLAQYSALMVMKQIYGPDEMRRFLKFELDNYLASRGSEAIGEQPLIRVENQQYIHYRKGSVVMYLLQDRLGEAAVNRALASLLAKYKFKGAPYPRSLDLVAALRAQAHTAADQALITDLLERITIYDLKADQPKAVRRADGKWDVTVPVVAAKFYADGKGKESATPLADTIAVGLFTAEPGHGKFDARNVILMERRPIHSGRQVLRFVTDKKPTHAGVDPYNLYIDRNSGDNVAAVS